jgi:hypothetical protein
LNQEYRNRVSTATIIGRDLPNKVNELLIWYQLRSNNLNSIVLAIADTRYDELDEIMKKLHRDMLLKPDMLDTIQADIENRLKQIKLPFKFVWDYTELCMQITYGKVIYF